MTKTTTDGRYWDLAPQPVLICRHCSSRATLVTIPRDEQADHDAWHAAEAERFEALEAEVLAARKAQA